MTDRGFVKTAIRGDEDDLERWKAEAKRLGMTLMDYLRKRVDLGNFDTQIIHQGIRTVEPHKTSEAK